MIARLIDELAATQPQEVRALVTLLGVVAQDGSYRDLVNKELKIYPNFETRKALLEQGHFDSQDFLQLLFATGGGTGTKVHMIMPLLNRLIEWGLVFNHAVSGGNARVNYQWNTPRISLFIALHIADNVLLGPAYVARKYRPSVPAVFIEKGGDKFTGTGFVATNWGNAKKYVLVTAKHNVDPADGLAFLGFSEPEGAKYTALAADWILHPTLDLAVMPVDCNRPPAPIFPMGSPAVLSRTITLGYPRIATADAPYMLAHGGELNAVVKTYFGEERVIISNVVAPGNSGGPVLDEAGLCLGIVVNAFETQHEGGIEKANSAIPAKQILDFITPFCR